MPPTEIRLEAIQSMLVAGHRSVRLERHTLLLWGGVGGLLCAFTEYVITAERFPDNTQRALVLLAWLTVWLGSAGLLDHRLTRRTHDARAETLPFAQAQITRAWWMLLAMGSLGSFAMFFHGGGSMIYALWIVLLGLGIYLFGLFSRSLIEWIGLATILLGVAGLASGLPFGTTRWLAASCFAIGLPLAGWLATRTDGTRVGARVLAVAFWLTLVTGTPLLVNAMPGATPVPAAPAMPLSALSERNGEQVVTLPAGTLVPLRMNLDSALLLAPPTAGLPIALRQSIEVALRDGQPDGRYRVADGPWRRVRDGLLSLRIYRIAPQLANGQAEIRVQAVFDVSEPSEDIR